MEMRKSETERSMILPTWAPGKIITPNFPKAPHRKKFLHKLLVKCPGYLLGGPVGEILERLKIWDPQNQKTAAF